MRRAVIGRERIGAQDQTRIQRGRDLVSIHKTGDTQSRAVGSTD